MFLQELSCGSSRLPSSDLERTRSWHAMSADLAPARTTRRAARERNKRVEKLQ